MAIERTGAAKEHFEKGQKFGTFQDDYAKAIAEYTEVIKLLPNDAESYDRRGSCYSSLGQDEKALDDYNKAISLEPQNGEYYMTRALKYIRLGENEKGAADIEKAVELNPKEAGKYYNMFGYVIFTSTGNKREAAVYLKKSVKHGDYCPYSGAETSEDLLKEWGM